MTGECSPLPELARPYFTRQAQLGRRIIFAWRPSDASPHNPLTTPWPAADEMIEGVEFVDEEAACRFDLDRAIGASGGRRARTSPMRGRERSSSPGRRRSGGFGRGCPEPPAA